MDFLYRIFKPFVKPQSYDSNDLLHNNLNFIVRNVWLPVPDSLVVADPRLAINSNTGTPASRELDQAINDFFGPEIAMRELDAEAEGYETFESTATFDMIRTLAGAGILSATSPGPRTLSTHSIDFSAQDLYIVPLRTKELQSLPKSSCLFTKNEVKRMFEGHSLLVSLGWLFPKKGDLVQIMPRKKRESDKASAYVGMVVPVIKSARDFVYLGLPGRSKPLRRSKKLVSIVGKARPGEK